MKAFVAVFLVLVCASACAAPTAAPTSAPAAQPTKAPAPTSAPKPTAAALARTATAPAGSPQPTRAGITLKGIEQKKGADGNVNTTANVATENLGIAQMELASPDTMPLDETRSIRLRISPAQQLVALPTIAAPAKTPDLPSFTWRFTGNTQLYTVMFAELRSLSFSMDQKGPIRRTIEVTKPVEWVWLVKPLAPGRQELALELSIPTTNNGVNSEMTTNVLQNLPVVIQVSAPPTPQVVVTPPSPKPTPSLMDRLGDSLIGEFGAVIAAVIGVLGTIIGGILKFRSRKTGS